ncbi:MAG: hypothetical protein ABIM50_07585 [Novosphingobium sp.]
MSNTTIFTHVSGKAVKGFQRLTKGDNIRIFASPASGSFTVVAQSDPKGASAKVIERKRG